MNDVLGGRYRLLEPIGSGGMATVWRATDEVLGRTVAVKVLTARHLGDRESRERIRQEARHAAAISHPHVAQVHDYGEEADFPFVVMELVPGGTLLQRINQGPMAPQAVMRLCGEVAGALAAAHAEGLVHRDVKPANIMLAPVGAKVVDFGIAAVVAPGRPDAERFEVLGTPTYLAPERLINDVVEPASDVYALGMLLYRLLSGRSPWTTEGTTQMLTAHIYVEPAPLQPIPGVPDYVISLCNRCLRKDPTERPSAREVAALLTRAAALAPEPAPAPAPADQSPSRLRRWMLAAALVAVAAPAAYLLLPGDDGPTAAEPQGAASMPASAAPASALPAPGTSPAARPSPGPTRVVTQVVTAPPTEPAPPTGPTTRPTAAPATAAPVPTSAGATTRTPTAPVERTLTSDAGSVRATCTAPRTAHILSWSAVKPYKIQSGDDQPGSAPTVTFKHGNSRLVMTVVCSGGVPSASSTAG